MRELNGVIWDFDGVLVDTGEFHFICWHETLSRYGIPFTWETFTQSFGPNNEGILRLLLAQDYFDEMCCHYDDQWEPTIAHCGFDN